MPGRTEEADAQQRQRASSPVHWYLLTAGFLAFSISTLVWTGQNSVPPRWDPADHLRLGLEYYEHLRVLNLVGLFEVFFYSTRYYPPFYHILIGLAALCTGPNPQASTVVNLVLLAAMMVSIYLLGRRLYSGEVGLVAALICPCYHINAALMHEAFIDFALVCWVGVSLYALECTDGFRSRKGSLCYGLVLAAGVLCKQPYIFFMGLPTALVALSNIRRRESLINLGWAVAVATLLASIWYLPHLGDVLEIYRVNREAALSENDPPVFSYFSNMTYIHVLASDQLQLPATGLLIVGFLFSGVLYARRSSPLYLCILSGIVIFTLIANKDSRYTAPVLPAVALISSCFLAQIRQDGLRIAVMLVLSFFGGLSFTYSQWPDGSPPLRVKTENYMWNVSASNYLGYDSRPGRDGWAMKEIVARIGHHPASDRRLVRVGFVCNEPNFNPSAFALYAEYWNLQNLRPKLRTEWLVSKAAEVKIRGCDYLVVRDAPTYKNELEQRYTSLIRSHPERFIKLAEFALPATGERAIIYRQAVEIEEWKTEISAGE